MPGAFTPHHRGGSGTPLVCLHGIVDTWRSWELVLPALEREHEVLAPTLAGHAGGPALDGPVSDTTLVAGVERAMDAAGWETAHIVGNSLGGYVALQLAQRGRARSVVALAPAGGWAPGDPQRDEVFDYFPRLREGAIAAAPNADAIVASREARRAITADTTVNYEHIPADLLAHQMRGVAGCTALPELVDFGRRADWPLDGAAITCPVRIVWGTADRLLPWPAAASRYRHDILPAADWVVLDDVGHCPQLDVPLPAAELILGHTR